MGAVASRATPAIEGGPLNRSGWPAHRRALNAVVVRGNIIDLEGDGITTAQVVVDRQIEHREVALAVCYVELGANQPGMLWPPAALRLALFDDK
jgi:hypothetical protein